MNKYCDNCNAYMETHVVKRNEPYYIKGYPIEVSGEVRICDTCGNSVDDIELDDKMLIQGFNKYRKIKNLLMPEEIKSIREKYNVCQKLFAKILGLDAKKIKSIERGGLQTESENNLILLMKNSENFYLLSERISHQED